MRLLIILAVISSYVNPFIGTAYVGHTFPGASCPLGLVQAGPETGNFHWKYCSGYNYEDSLILGFSQNRLSGTGCPDLGDIRMMPYCKTVRPDYSSAFDRGTETAAPGYYAVTLTDNDVRVEISCTPHVAVHKYSFGTQSRNLLVDFATGLTWTPRRDSIWKVMRAADVKVKDSKTITGYLHPHTWVGRDLYFVVSFDTPFESLREFRNNDREKAPKYDISFADGKKPVHVKVALSTVSVENAEENLESEVRGWNFNRVRRAASKEWNKYLGLAKVKGTDDQKTNFYTALYHLFIQPNNIADVNGDYCGADGKVHNAGNGGHYSTLSQWDTFRAADPFYQLMTPEFSADLVNSMLRQSEEQGFLPIWALWGQENYCMIGNHSVPVVCQAALEGLPGVDAERVYREVRKSLTENHKNSIWELYDTYGYYPFDLIEVEAASRTLECGYDDWCAYLLADKLGYADDAAFFWKRSQYYRNLFDPEYKLFRARDTKGGWRTPFFPEALDHAEIGGDFTEGNALQYNWHVMQDIPGLMELMGGPEEMEKQLDRMFSLPELMEGQRTLHDVTGLIGQYAHGNEPSHHVIYLYTLAGNRNRTAELVREVFDKFYKPRPDGLCGNDDCGQMSAWYVFSAMGFYPVDPISGEFVLGAPQIGKVTLKLPGGKKFTVKAEGLSEKNKYVGSVSLNGETLDKTITRGQILGGGTLIFKMTDSK